MRKLTTIIGAILITFFIQDLKAQSVSGKLYLTSYPSSQNASDSFGYISYPNPTYHSLGSFKIDDFRIKENIITTAGPHIYRFDTDTHQIIDSLPNQYANQFDYWHDKIVVVHDSIPYLRVFNQDLSLDFSIDTNIVAEAPNDILVEGDKAYLTLHNRIKIIHLKVRDSVVVQNQTPIPPYFGNYQELFKTGEKVYAAFDWWTALPWVNLFEIDLAADSFIQVTDQIFGGTYLESFPANDRIYMGYGLNYYDLALDTLVNYGMLGLNATAFHEPSNSLFVFRTTEPTSQEWSLYTLHDSILIDSVEIPGRVMQTRFLEENSTQIDKNKIGNIPIQISPNPSSRITQINWENQTNSNTTLSIHDLSGRKVYHEIVNRNISKIELDITQWTKGIYLVKILSGTKSASKKLIVN